MNKKAKKKYVDFVLKIIGNLKVLYFPINVIVRFFMMVAIYNIFIIYGFRVPIVLQVMLWFWFIMLPIDRLYWALINYRHNRLGGGKFK